MLILTRSFRESLYIGDDIIVTVCDVRGSQVKLGVDAPQHIDVHREEIYHRIRQQQARELGREPLIPGNPTVLRER